VFPHPSWLRAHVTCIEQAAESWIDILMYTQRPSNVHDIKRAATTVRGTMSYGCPHQPDHKLLPLLLTSHHMISSASLSVADGRWATKQDFTMQLTSSSCRRRLPAKRKDWFTCEKHDERKRSQREILYYLAPGARKVDGYTAWVGVPYRNWLDITCDVQSVSIATITNFISYFLCCK